MNEQVIVIGAGGHGKVIADIARSCCDTVLGFLDDSPNPPEWFAAFRYWAEREIMQTIRKSGL